MPEGPVIPMRQPIGFWPVLGDILGLPEGDRPTGSHILTVHPFVGTPMEQPPPVAGSPSVQ